MKKHWNAELQGRYVEPSIAVLREAGEQIDELKKGFQGGAPRATRGHGMGNRVEGEQRDELDRVQDLVRSLSEETWGGRRARRR